MYQPVAHLPSLRALKRMLRLSEVQHMTRTADSLGRSQSAVTKSITALENQLNVRLFERTPTGMKPTSQGKILCRRVRLAIEELGRAREAYSEADEDANRGRNFFNLDISNHRLMTFLALFDYRDLRKAAHATGHDLSAIRKSIRALEEELGCTLFERAPHGTVLPTPFASILAQRAKLAVWEIRTGLDEIASLEGATQGTLVVGVICHARTAIVPRAINLLLRQHPTLHVETHDGDYDALEVALSYGDIDFIVGSLRAEPSSPDLIAEPLMADRIQVIARRGHPLEGCECLSLQQIAELEWVLPPKHVPMRHRLIELLQEHGLRGPRSQIESSSPATIKGLLLESDRVALSSHVLFQRDIEHGILSILPTDVFGSVLAHGTPMMIHLTMRVHASYPPIAHLFRNVLKDVARQIEWSIRKTGDDTVVPIPRRRKRARI